MKGFVKVRSCDGVVRNYENVPTKEEYEDFQQRVGKQLNRLESRIAVIEKPLVEEPEKEEYYKASIFSIANGEIELSGTEAQHKIFEKSREEIDKGLFPKFLTWDKLVLLALDCGLSVKKIKRGIKNESTRQD